MIARAIAGALWWAADALEAAACRLDPPWAELPPWQPPPELKPPGPPKPRGPGPVPVPASRPSPASEALMRDIERELASRRLPRRFIMEGNPGPRQFVQERFFAGRHIIELADYPARLEPLPKATLLDFSKPPEPRK